jgi:hypothetical protein
VDHQDRLLHELDETESLKGDQEVKLPTGVAEIRCGAEHTCTFHCSSEVNITIPKGSRRNKLTVIDLLYIAESATSVNLFRREPLVPLVR